MGVKRGPRRSGNHAFVAAFPFLGEPYERRIIRPVERMPRHAPFRPPNAIHLAALTVVEQERHNDLVLALSAIAPCCDHQVSARSMLAQGSRVAWPNGIENGAEITRVRRSPGVDVNHHHRAVSPLSRPAPALSYGRIVL